jgi:hypothetical protein
LDLNMLEGMSEEGKRLLKIRSRVITDDTCCFNCQFWDRDNVDELDYGIKSAPCNWSKLANRMRERFPDEIPLKLFSTRAMKSTEYFYCVAFLSKDKGTQLQQIQG